MYDSQMFDKIKQALTKSTAGENSRYKDIIKLEPGNVYTVRLIPNINSPEHSLYKYYTHAWESYATGKYVSTVSPTTWGDKDPIAEAKFSMMKHGTEDEKKKAESIIRRENWLANVYVINDPTKPENNRQCKLLRFGRQLHKIFMSAIDGEDSSEFGSRIFDLSGEGCNLKIKVESQGEYPTYVSSRFSSPSKIEGLTDDMIKSIYEKAISLDKVFTVKTYDELKDTLNEHFHCNKSKAVNSMSAETIIKAESVSPISNASDSTDPLDDDKVKSLLEGLNG